MDKTTYVVKGLGKVYFRGHTPQGWPLVNLITDRPGFGTLVIQGDKGKRLNEEISATAE